MVLGLFMLSGVPPFLGAVYKFLVARSIARLFGARGFLIFVFASTWLLFLYLGLSLTLLTGWHRGPHKRRPLSKSAAHLSWSVRLLPLLLLLR